MGEIALRHINFPSRADLQRASGIFNTLLLSTVIKGGALPKIGAGKDLTHT